MQLVNRCYFFKFFLFTVERHFLTYFGQSLDVKFSHSDQESSQVNNLEQVEGFPSRFLLNTQTTIKRNIKDNKPYGTAQLTSGTLKNITIKH